MILKASIWGGEEGDRGDVAILHQFGKTGTQRPDVGPNNSLTESRDTSRRWLLVTRKSILFAHIALPALPGA